jgi:hypothetical protein
MVAVDSQRRGCHQVTLTEIDTTTIPQVAAGSMVEVGGSLYEADNNETIDTSFEVDPAVGGADTYYICLVPTTGVVTPSWTTYAPEWSDAKQGWYGDGVNVAANCRYIKYKVEYDGSDYNKEYFLNNNVIIPKTLVMAYKSSPSSSATSIIINPLIFDTEVYDIANEYNNSTGIFTAKFKGIYRVNAIAWCENSSNLDLAQLRVFKNSNIFTTAYFNYLKSNYFAVSLSILMDLDVNDTIKFFVEAQGSAGTSTINGDATSRYTYLCIESINKITQ